VQRSPLYQIWRGSVPALPPALKSDGTPGALQNRIGARHPGQTVGARRIGRQRPEQVIVAVAVNFVERAKLAQLSLVFDRGAPIGNRNSQAPGSIIQHFFGERRARGGATQTF
jgi:hypothetical protein